MKTVIEVRSGDDWEQLVVNGKVLMENHSLHLRDLIEEINLWIPHNGNDVDIKYVSGEFDEGSGEFTEDKE
jgi:hypothetical protein